MMNSGGCFERPAQVAAAICTVDGEVYLDEIRYSRSTKDRVRPVLYSISEAIDFFPCREAIGGSFEDFLAKNFQQLGRKLVRSPSICSSILFLVCFAPRTFRPDCFSASHRYAQSQIYTSRCFFKTSFTTLHLVSFPIRFENIHFSANEATPVTTIG
jgi:hypothetical protein